ncbi:MAG: cytochrome P450 [Undibacterium sp.]|nr:cytochrome P450 [Undibacterium sp.]
MLNYLSPLSLPNAKNPYPYYAMLRQAEELIYDQQHQLWVVSRAQLVQEILEDERFVVRPTAQTIPANILGSSAGEVFADLMRMNEGERHAIPKQVFTTSFRQINFSEIHQHLISLSMTLDAKTDLNEWIMSLAVKSVAKLCGFAEAELVQVYQWTADFVACLSALSTPEQLVNASVAAKNLQLHFDQLLQQATPQANSLLSSLQQEAQQLGWHQCHELKHNLIGLLSQSYEATAGLIANSMVVLQGDVELRKTLQTQPESLPAFIEEVLRYDAPIQNTRRFVTQNCRLAGQELQAGECLLLLLASANRDSQHNSEADQFQLHRTNRRSFSFSHARHLCPGQTLAKQITTHALASLLQQFSTQDWQDLQWTYRPSHNARIPQFHSKEAT